MQDIYLVKTLMIPTRSRPERIRFCPSILHPSIDLRWRTELRDIDLDSSIGTFWDFQRSMGPDGQHKGFLTFRPYKSNGNGKGHQGIPFRGNGEGFFRTFGKEGIWKGPRGGGVSIDYCLGGPEGDGGSTFRAWRISHMARIP